MYFLYLIEGNLTPATLQAAGLGYLPDADTLTTRGMLDGPAGAGRMMVADGRQSAQRMVYKPDQQIWLKSANGKFWVGTWNDAIPCAGSLRRPSQVAGHTIQLNNCGLFTIPLARKFPAGTNLPMSMVLTSEGLTLKEKPQFVGFSMRAEKLWRHFCRQVGWLEPDGADVLTVEEQFNLCIEALGINYYLGADEASLLGLIDTAVLDEIAIRIVDVPTLKSQLADRLESLKKKDCALPTASLNGPESSSSGNDPDGTPRR
jgi:hypothetical protein